MPRPRRPTGDAPPDGLPAASVRMEDVARAARVSTITVSRALNAPGKLAPPTLARVREAITRLRYVPNLVAGSLASNRSRVVAAIVPTIANSIFAETVEGLAKALARERYQLMLGETGYQAGEEAALVDAFLGRRVDGLVLTGVAHARGLRARLARARVPVVETWDLSARPIDMVAGFSNVAAGRAVARYLAGKGYRSLAFIGGVEDRSRKRLAGFREAARACGIASVAVAIVPPRSTPADGAAAFARLVAGDRPRGVFCSNDQIAAGVLFECARRRIAVPRAIGVVGFADLPIASAIEPTLTSVQVRASDMGRTAGEMLLARCAGKALPHRIADLGFAIVERASA